MGQAAAKQGDRIVAIDTHIVVTPAGVASPAPHPFSGILNGGLSGDVNIMGMPAAMAGSTADNVPPHLPTPPGVAFQAPPANRATVKTGSGSVNINGKMAARAGDTAMTCNDPADLPTGQVLAVGTVFIGG